MALFAGSALFGTGLGPLCSGFIAQHLYWRWVFYVQVIYGSLLILAVAIFFKETRGSVLLSRRAKLLNSWYEAREKVGLVGEEITIDGNCTMESQRVRWKVQSDEERETLAKMIGISVYRPFRRLYLSNRKVMKLISYRFAIDRARCLLLFSLGFVQLGRAVPNLFGNTACVHQKSSIQHSREWRCLYR